MSELQKNLLSWYEFQPDRSKVEVRNPEDLDRLEDFYDYIVIIPDNGVDIYNAVKVSAAHLSDSGVMILAADNKFALKYWSGVANESSGLYFGSITGCDLTTISKNDIKKLEEIGLFVKAVYYPYPDIRFPRSVYKKEYIEKTGINPCSLTPSFEKDRYVMFSEADAMKELMDEGIWENFVNAFILILCKESENVSDDGNLLYARFNSERAPEYRVNTFIKESDGKIYVEKSADSKEAEAHLERIRENYKRIEKLYKSISPVPCEAVKKQEDGLGAEQSLASLNFPYLEGVTLDKKLADDIKSLDRGNDTQDSVFKLITSYLEIIFDYNAEMLDGEGDPKVSNVDSIFSNFILAGSETEPGTSGKIYLIDYEWVYEKSMPIDYLRYRTVFYFYQDHPEVEELLSLEKLLHLLGMTDESIEKYKALEDKFQQKIYGDGWKYQIRGKYAKKNISFEGLEEDFRLKENHIKNLEESNEKLRRFIKNPVAGLIKRLRKHN